MNPVFWVIVILIGVVAWFALSPLFKLIGGFFLSIFNDATDFSEEEDGTVDDKKNEQ